VAFKSPLLNANKKPALNIMSVHIVLIADIMLTVRNAV